MVVTFNAMAQEVDKAFLLCLCLYKLQLLDFFNYNVLIFPLAHFHQYNACSSACIK